MTSLSAARRVAACRNVTFRSKVRAWFAPGRVLVAATFMFASVPASLPAQSSRTVAALDSAAHVDSRTNSILGRLVSVDFDDLPLALALHYIAQAGQIRLSYSSDVVPVTRRVSLARIRTPVGEVLRAALANTNVDPVVTPSGYVVLVRNPRATTMSNASDSLAIAPLYAMPIRAQVMDRVLVMGTPAAGAPERELPSAVTVLTANQIAAYGPSSMQDLLRGGIPGVVAWDLGIAGPFAQIGSVRGSSSFTSNYLKTYVDGVELASPYLLFAVDPYSIERIEIIRGPQGSALYGSDAISGVVHVVTRRGTPSSEWKPAVDAQLSGGLVASRYVEGAIASQRHSAMVSTGGGTTSLGLGGTWSSTGGIVPGGESGYRATFGGFQSVTGWLRVEGSMRYADVRFTAPENPLLRGDTLLAQYRSMLEEQRIENETYGLTLDANPVEGLRHTLVIGIDRHDGAIPLQREPATVADALLGATRERASKQSIRFSTALRVIEGTHGGATLTLGSDHTTMTRERLGQSSEVGGDSINNELSALYRDDIRNYGVFAQMKVDLARSIFITGGVRGDRNSTFGESILAAWSPMLGIAMTRDAGTSTFKVRGAYGKGIRPPPPSAQRAIATLKFRQTANPALEPESQSGFEGGVEWFAGDFATLSLTGYTQTAKGLIQQVLQDRRTIQYQNVGQIANRGMELEGQWRFGMVRANGTFSLTESRVKALAPAYSGDLEVGDRVPEVPSSSGSIALSWDVARATVTFGGVYIGRWTGYDWSRYVGETQQNDSTSTLRDYWRRYPAIVRPYLSVSHVLNRDVEWFGRIDNLTNVQRYERDNLQVTAGRTMTVGLRIGR